MVTLSEDRHLNYLSVGTEKYRIKDFNKFLRGLGESDNFQTTLTGLIASCVDPAVLENFELGQFQQFILQATDAFTQWDLSQKALLARLETLLNVKPALCYLELLEEERYGYLIEGQLNSYLLEVDFKDYKKEPKIYKYPSGEYLCVIDKTIGLNGWEKAFNRALALKNDTHLTTQIHTLQD